MEEALPTERGEFHLYRLPSCGAWFVCASTTSLRIPFHEKPQWDESFSGSRQMRSHKYDINHDIILDENPPPSQAETAIWSLRSCIKHNVTRFQFLWSEFTDSKVILKNELFIVLTSITYVAGSLVLLRWSSFPSMPSFGQIRESSLSW